MLNRRCQSRRQLLLLVGCAVLLVAAPSLYLSYTYYYYDPAAAGRSMWLDLLRPLPNTSDDTNIGQTGGQDSSWLPIEAPGVHDDVDDPAMILLHPEQHIFRDPTTIRMTWNVTMEQRAPDGVMRPVYLINGGWSR